MGSRQCGQVLSQVGRELYARVPSNYNILYNNESFLNSMIKPTHQRHIQAFQLSQTLDTQVFPTLFMDGQTDILLSLLASNFFREFKTVLLFET